MCPMHLQPSKFGGMAQMCEYEHVFGMLNEDCRCCSGSCDECKKTDDIKEAAKKRIKTSLQELNKFQAEQQGPLQDQLVQASARIDVQKLADTTRLDAEIKQNKDMMKEEGYSLMPLPTIQHSEHDKVLARLGREEREKQELVREAAAPLGGTTCPLCSNTNLPTHQRCLIYNAYNIHNEMDSNAEKRDIMVDDILMDLKRLIGQEDTASLDGNRHLRGVKSDRRPFTESWAREFAVRRLPRWAKRMNDAGWIVDPATVSVAYWWKYHDGAVQEIEEAGYDREQFENFMPQL